MKILIKGDFVDFEAPMYMGEKQKSKFIDFFTNSLKMNVKVLEITEKERFHGLSEKKPKRWTFDEYQILFTSPLSNKYLATKLKRSEMSVQMQRGNELPAFLAWAKKNGYTSNNESTIKKYLVEKGFLK